MYFEISVMITKRRNLPQNNLPQIKEKQEDSSQLTFELVVSLLF